MHVRKTPMPPDEADTITTATVDLLITLRQVAAKGHPTCDRCGCLCLHGEPCPWCTALEKCLGCGAMVRVCEPCGRCVRAAQQRRNFHRPPIVPAWRILEAATKAGVA